MNKTENKRSYKKPTMDVVLLKVRPQLLAGSGDGLATPNDYPGGGDPLGF